MSRSGYNDDKEDRWAMIRWRGAVASATKGKRGQALLRDLLAALDAMPEKALIQGALETDGEFCALGVLGRERGIDMSKIDPEDPDQVAQAFDVAAPLAREIVYHNDEYIDDSRWIEFEICGPMRPRWPDYGRHHCTMRAPNEHAANERWAHMRKWVESQLVKTAPVVHAPEGL